MTNDPDIVSRQTHDARTFNLDQDPSARDGQTVECGGVERMDLNYEVRRNDFPYFAIEWVSEGNGILTMNGRDHELAAGSLFAYGPGIPHRIRNSPPSNMRKYYLDVSGSEAESSLDELGLLELHPISVSRPFELVEIWNLIDREARE